MCCRDCPVPALYVSSPHDASRAHLEGNQKLASAVALTTSGPSLSEQIPHSTHSYFQSRMGEFHVSVSAAPTSSLSQKT